MPKEEGRDAEDLSSVEYVEPDHADQNCVTKPASHGRVLGQGTLG